MLLEPGDGLEVEMVGRLVQQQEVGLDEEHGGKRHPHPPPAREGGQRSSLRLLVEAQPLQDAGGTGRCRVGADGTQPVMDLGEPGRLRRHLQLGQEGCALAVGGQHALQRGQLAARRLLRHHPDPHPGLKAQAAFVRLQLARDQPQQGRLAGAVAADEAEALARRQMEGGRFEERPPGDPQGDVVEIQHGSSSRSCLAWRPRAAPGHRPARTRWHPRPR